MYAALLFVLAVPQLVPSIHANQEETEIEFSELEGVELYDWIGHIAVQDPDWNEESINQRVEQGIQSEDPEIVAATICSMAWIAAYSQLSDEDDRSTQSISRNLALIPGLKQFLIDYWEIALGDQKNPWLGTDYTQFVEVRSIGTVWRLEWAWLTIPGILVTFFPEDEDVHELIWQAEHPHYPELMLSLLNVGQFNTKKATDFRIECLLNKNLSMFAVTQSAESLGRFKPHNGLAALISRLQREETSQELAVVLLGAIVSYGDKTKPYSNIIKNVARKFELEVPDSAELEQLNNELLLYLMFMVKNGFTDESTSAESP